jgi:hypothetical protein
VGPRVLGDAYARALRSAARKVDGSGRTR